MAQSGPCNFSYVRLDGHECTRSIRYFLRKETEEMSPSWRDGIDLRKERSVHASYCRFLQESGMRLIVPQTTIAVAMLFCHRFFLQQFHAKNDMNTIATACMLVAAKVMESFHLLRHIIPVAYEIIHKDDCLASQKIKQKEAYQQQMALILLAESVVLVTLAFNFSVDLPYTPLGEAINKVEGSDKIFRQAAWNFVNDALQTSRCLQYDHQYIAGGAFLLAAKFAKAKLPSEGEFWLRQFNITPQQLKEITHQMMEMYDVRDPPEIACEGSSRSRHDPPTTSSQTVGANLVLGSEHSQAVGLADAETHSPLPA